MKYSALVFCFVLSIASFAQTKKSPAKPAAPAKPAPQRAATPVPQMKTEFDSVAYAIGMNVAQSIKSQGLGDINVDLVNKGLRDWMRTGKGDLDEMQMQMVLSTYFGRLQQQKQAEQAKLQAEEAKKYEANKIAGQQFLEENKKKSNVITLPSGLQYEIIKTGDGPKPTINNTVKTHYHGTLVDGTVFDSSVERGQPAEFPVGGVIQGWVEALQLMPVGSKWKLYLPYNLAYGERSAGPTIKPYSALVFEVELLEIVR
ncbi:MAG: FKBP-type peptidyl-prolyl cis-trans isomerase [Runella sp.]